LSKGYQHQQTILSSDDPVGLTRPDDNGLGGGYNRYEIFVVGTGGSLTRLGEVGEYVSVTLTGNKWIEGKIDLTANQSLFAGLTVNTNFVIKAVFDDADGHKVNSLEGKFKLTATQLGVINAL
jgi:hypothetical protein